MLARPFNHVTYYSEQAPRLPYQLDTSFKLGTLVDDAFEDAITNSDNEDGNHERRSLGDFRPENVRGDTSS